MNNYQRFWTLKIFVAIFILCSWVLFFPKKIFAVSISINNFPQIINSIDSFQVSVNITGATNATNYLRVDLYKDGSSNYFGETYNGSDWYGKNYYPIQIQNSSASASFYFQLGNPTLSQYPEPGNYKLKIRRYTSSGSASSNDIQTPVDVQITYVFSTSTPSPTTTPIPTSDASSPIPTPPPRTTTPTPVKTLIPSSTPKTSVAPTATSSPQEQPVNEPSSILGAETFSPSPTTASSQYPKTKPPLFAFILIGVGIVVIGTALYLGTKSSKTSHVQNDI